MIIRVQSGIDKVGLDLPVKYVKYNSSYAGVQIQLLPEASAENIEDAKSLLQQFIDKDTTIYFNSPLLCTLVVSKIEYVPADKVILVKGDNIVWN